MITASWPPVGRVGARRPLRLARRLPTYGWEPVILTPEPEAVFRAPPTLDHSLAVPPVEVWRVGRTVPSTRLHRLSARLPGPARRIIRRALADALVPDQYPEWLPAALSAARKAGEIDAVWATGGPFGVFVVGAVVAATLGVPLALDYRDPWTIDALPRRSPLAPTRGMLRRLERALLGRAAAVSYVNADMRERNRIAFGDPGAGVPWRVIPNGFDPIDVAGVAPLRPLRPTLLYAGACYGSRSMKPILAALHAAHGPGEAGLQLRMFGELDPGARRFLDAHPLPGRVRVRGRVPAAELAGHLRGADGLLLIIGAEHRTALSAKVFDYLQAERPIVVYGPADCAAAALVRRCGVGVAAHDGASLIAALDQVDRRAVPYEPVTEAIREYSADAMAESTAALLDAAIAGR